VPRTSAGIFVNRQAGVMGSCGREDLCLIQLILLDIFFGLCEIAHGVYHALKMRLSNRISLNCD